MVIVLSTELVQPLLSTEVKPTLYEPGALYLWVGLFSLLVEPSPNFQVFLSDVDVVIILKSTVLYPTVSQLNAMTGGLLMVMLVLPIAVSIFVPETVTLTVYVPAALYLCVGSSLSLITPSPKSHSKELYRLAFEHLNDCSMPTQGLPEILMSCAEADNVSATADSIT
jgi:hypothetical protein